MLPRSSAPLWKVCCAGLLLALLGCGRSAVMVAPESATHADEPAAAPPPLARGQAPQPDAAPFTFPDDAGGVLLAKVLPPNDTDAARVDRRRPVHRSAPSLHLKPPTLPLPLSRPAMPRMPAPRKAAPLRPRLTIDETMSLPRSPRLPQAPSLPDDGRIRVPSADVNQPIPLPILAQRVSDRASLDDPTLETSTAGATAAPIPSRTSKAPFLKGTLPDPYDRRRTGVPAAEESKEFPLGSPQTPRR